MSSELMCIINIRPNRRDWVKRFLKHGPFPNCQRGSGASGGRALRLRNKPLLHKFAHQRHHHQLLGLYRQKSHV